MASKHTDVASSECAMTVLISGTVLRHCAKFHVTVGERNHPCFAVQIQEIFWWPSPDTEVSMEGQPFLLSTGNDKDILKLIALITPRSSQAPSTKKLPWLSPIIETTFDILSVSREKESPCLAPFVRLRVIVRLTPKKDNKHQFGRAIFSNSLSQIFSRRGIYLAQPWG